MDLQVDIHGQIRNYTILWMFISKAFSTYHVSDNCKAFDSNVKFACLNFILRTGVNSVWIYFKYTSCVWQIFKTNVFIQLPILLSGGGQF